MHVDTRNPISGARLQLSRCERIHCARPPLMPLSSLCARPPRAASNTLFHRSFIGSRGTNDLFPRTFVGLRGTNDTPHCQARPWPRRRLIVVIRRRCEQSLRHGNASAPPQWQRIAPGPTTSDDMMVLLLMVIRHGLRGTAPTLHLPRAKTYDGDDGAAAADAAAAAAAGVEARI